MGGASAAIDDLGQTMIKPNVFRNELGSTYILSIIRIIMSKYMFFIGVTVVDNV